MQIDCASGGRQAVEAIRNEQVRYDAVFMDHMMPDIDGIEAVRLIREIGTDYAKNIPIIALTANAIVGNEDMFLSKGFQAFLSKPIDLPRLDEVIRRWVRDKTKEEEAADGLPAAECQIEKAGLLHNVKIDGLDLRKGIEKFNGDEEVYLRVLRSYTANTKKLLDSAENPTPDRLEEYAITVHGIKGASRGILADAVGDATEKLEYAAKEGDCDFVDSHNPAFLDSARKLIGDIERTLSELDAENPKPVKAGPDTGTLSKLLAACRAYDADGVDEATAELEAYQYESDDGLAAWLIENAKLSNFSQIAERLGAYDY